MKKSWPSYVAIAIICIPLFVVLGFAAEFSVKLLSAIKDVLTLVVPMILAWVIGYMDDAESLTKDVRPKKAIINTVIAGILCGVAVMFSNAVCIIITIIMAAIIAVRFKEHVCEYRKMKEELSSGTDDRNNAE